MRRSGTRFFGNLLHASTPGGPCTVIVTMRADFYPHAAAYPAFAQAVSAHQYLVGPLGRDELRQIIEQPAIGRRVGAAARSGRSRARRRRERAGCVAVARACLVGAVGTPPGRHADARRLRRDSAGWPGRWRHEPIRSGRRSPPPSRAAAKQVLLRLTQPGEGAEDTRRPATLDEIATTRGAAEDVERVVQKLADARLVTTSGDDDPIVEVSHEALIRAWPRLREWIEREPGGPADPPTDQPGRHRMEPRQRRRVVVARAPGWQRPSNGRPANPGELNQLETAIPGRQPKGRAHPNPPPTTPSRRRPSFPLRPHHHRRHPQCRRPRGK